MPTWLVIVVIALPFAFAVLFGISAFRGQTAQLYRCRCCAHSFRRAPHRPFPPACPRCRATDWAA